MSGGKIGGQGGRKVETPKVSRIIFRWSTIIISPTSQGVNGDSKKDQRTESACLHMIRAAGRHGGSATIRSKERQLCKIFLKFHKI